MYYVKPRQLTVVEGPAAEPVSLTQMKAHLRVDYSDDDTLIASQITEARAWMEKALNVTMVEQTFDAILPCFPEIAQFPGLPITAVVSVKYWDTNSPSTLTTLSDSSTSPVVTSSVFRVDTNEGRIYRAHGQSWPSAAIRHDAVTVRLTAGPAPTGSPLVAQTPAPLQAALKLLVGDMYENRESSSPLNIHELPAAKRLMQTYRNY